MTEHDAETDPMNSSSEFITNVFASKGQVIHQPCGQCPTDETLAGYLDRALSASEHRAVEDHALSCPHTQQLVKAVAGLQTSASTSTARPGLRIRARLARRGLALLNAAELTLRDLSSGQLALGASRGQEPTDLIRISGPGAGLDEIELQAQADGSVRVVVSGDLAGSHTDERTSLVLEVDGLLREKRPYSGERLAFTPLAAGDCRITLLRRSPGGPTTEVSEARIELCA